MHVFLRTRRDTKCPFEKSLFSYAQEKIKRYYISFQKGVRIVSLFSGYVFFRDTYLFFVPTPEERGDTKDTSCKGRDTTWYPLFYEGIKKYAQEKIPAKKYVSLLCTNKKIPLYPIPHTPKGCGVRGTGYGVQSTRYGVRGTGYQLLVRSKHPLLLRVKKKTLFEETLTLFEKIVSLTAKKYVFLRKKTCSNFGISLAKKYRVPSFTRKKK